MNIEVANVVQIGLKVRGGTRSAVVGVDDDGLLFTLDADLCIRRRYFSPRSQGCLDSQSYSIGAVLPVNRQVPDEQAGHAPLRSAAYRHSVTIVEVVMRHERVGARTESVDRA